MLKSYLAIPVCTIYNLLFEHMKKLTVLGVCGAQGALLFPFRKYLIGNVEPRSVFHTKGEEQWKLNFGGIPFTRSLDKFQDSKPDIIMGSPSCGHSSVFSYSRKKTLGKPREDITLNLFVESILKFRPKIFLMENLPKLLDLIPLEEWSEKLSMYDLIVHCHSVFDFGNSQKSRKRLVLIGVKKGSKIKIDHFNKIFPVNKPFLVKDIDKMIRKELNFTEDGSKKLAMYHFNDKNKRTLTVNEVKSLWNGDFMDEWKWPMKGTKMKTLPGVYRNKPTAYPLTIRPSNRQFNPSGLPMGLEEFRVIMGFPKRYKVYFDPKDRTYWLNKSRNALSKGSVYEVGKWFKRCLFRAHV